MKPSSVLTAPPDQAQRIIALDPKRSILVQAPAGSGKTDLLTRRFLSLLAIVDDPKHIVAITFTKAAAAEMRHRILSELEKAASCPHIDAAGDESSMEALAARALDRSRQLNWRLLELSSQLRISTVDSFCRDLAMQQPVYSGIGNNLEINERPAALYRLAAGATVERLGDPHHRELSDSIRDLLLWRDNNWNELQDLLVKMLAQRDRWMHDFVLSHSPDWNRLREHLERPLANAVRNTLQNLALLLGPDACNEAHELAQFACDHGATQLHKELAERANFPHGPYHDNASLDDARSAFLCVANLLLNGEGEFRVNIDRRLGFSKEHLDEKLRLQDLIGRLSDIEGLRAALVQLRTLPPARYSEEDWRIIRASFMLLRHAAAELRTVFAEAGTIDFIEVAQIARTVLRGEDNLPSDAARAVADDIHHLLVDEFQDTSRRQHDFITALIEAWPDTAGRTIFVVGDPMQSIYFFRDAEAELFVRVKQNGFELATGESFPLHPVALKANFRTDPLLVDSLNHSFQEVFARADGSGIEFSAAEPARQPGPRTQRLQLHLAFIPQAERGSAADPDLRQAARAKQISEIVAIISSHRERIRAARAAGNKYRIAILGRARTALAPIAAELRTAGIPFRAVELESLKDRPEILDAVALARALLNREDRVAWLGVLRAPWCGLSLAELHAIAGVDGPRGSAAPVPDLLRDRMNLLAPASRKAAQRVLDAFASIPHVRSTLPTATTGTLLQHLWRALGGDSCVDANARANLELLWDLADKLPNGEQDLAGPALDDALQDLCALPDPASSSDCGVQLMTIHKSKGLEFEVVVVPELQARGGNNKPELLSWLERGIPAPDQSGELTEFLIAPLQYKGEDPGQARSWVERMRREREQQEMRRILYVAATRAREELHLFTQLTYKTAGDGTLNLTEPSNCLLATAWPAFANEIRARFDQWQRASREAEATQQMVLPAVAAGRVVEMPSSTSPTMIRRLPPDFELPSAAELSPAHLEPIIGLGDVIAYERHEGGLLSRALGIAIHKLLEELARLRTAHGWDEARAKLAAVRPRIASLIRSAGIPPADSEELTARAFKIAIDASHDPHGQWILLPHNDASSESDWTGVVDGKLRSIRVDRLFRAGLDPLAAGDLALWIIDYKTAQSENLDQSSLRQLRAIFAPQLKAYADVLRRVHGESTPLRACLYYPAMRVFDWWEI